MRSSEKRWYNSHLNLKSRSSIYREWKKMMSLQDSEPQIRILVVDDHPFFRAGLSERISRVDGWLLVGEASDGLSAYNLTAALTPHLILMDVNMPGTGGMEATKRIKSDFPEVQIIALSADDSLEDIKQILQAGASGYLLKTVTELELRTAILDVLRGGSALTPQVARNLISDLRQPHTTRKKLSDQELNILQMAAQGLTNEKISKTLFLSVRTIETHMHNIFKKLDVTSRTEAVVHGLKFGLINTESVA